MKTIKINDITLRDIFQSIDPGDLDRKKLLAILEGYEGLEYDSLEIMGGSSFEKILETGLNMNPFQVCSFIKSIITATPLQALIGTRNLIGLEIYDRSLMKRFIRESIKNGISIFRVYDSLNDIENFRHTVSEIVESDASCQGTIIYDDLQDGQYYVKTAEKLVDMGCSSICIKDAESTMIPHRAAEIFSLMSDSLEAPVYFSASDLRGLQTLNYFEAAVNGCNGFDLSFLPSSYNDFTPTVFSFLLSLKDSDIGYNVDYQKITEQGELIKKHVYPFIKQDLFSTRFILNQTNTNLLPKWLITDINNQLVEIGEAGALDQVLEEVSKIKSEIGNPSLSTPVGQIVGSQAVLNSVVSEKRWEILSDEVRNLIQGVYGRLPRKVDSEIQEIVGNIPETEKDRAQETDVFSDCSRELEGVTDRDEDILSYCFFPEKTRAYLESKTGGTAAIRQTTSPAAATRRSAAGGEEPVPLSSLKDLDTKKLKEIASIVDSSNIDEINLELDGIKITINNMMDTKTAAGQRTSVPPGSMASQAGEGPELGADETGISSPIVGTYYASPSPEDPAFVKAGDSIRKGDTLFIVEAMKHMNRVNSEFDGTVSKILVQNEEAVEYGQTVMIIKKD
jgi:oxaloacetate decarboxylase (Na+ extruding) subunit alpha